MRTANEIHRFRQPEIIANDTYTGRKYISAVAASYRMSLTRLLTPCEDPVVFQARMVAASILKDLTLLRNVDIKFLMGERSDLWMLISTCHRMLDLDEPFAKFFLQLCQCLRNGTSTSAVIAPVVKRRFEKKAAHMRTKKSSRTKDERKLIIEVVERAVEVACIGSTIPKQPIGIIGLFGDVQPAIPAERKKRKPARASIDSGIGANDYAVTIEDENGKPYELQYF